MPTPSEPLVTVRDLTVTFSRWGQTVTALDQVSLSIPSGQWLLVVGPNGSGKSTLLSAMAGTTVPTAGHVHVNGARVHGLPASGVAHRVFHVHQNPLQGTAPGLTVEENLRVADSSPGLSRDRGSQRRRYLEWLQPLGLDERLRQPVESLSGGERQLLALLIGRLRAAPLLLLDEPLAAMDPGKAAAAFDQLATLNREGRTLVQVTHEPDLIRTFHGRVIALQVGRVVYDSTSDGPPGGALRWVFPGTA